MISSEIVDVDALPDIETTPPERASRTCSCTGFVVKFPPGKTAHSSYPFALHDEISLPWDYAVQNGVLTLRARTCTGRATDKSSSCGACLILNLNKSLHGILHRINNGVHENAKFAYHAHGGMVIIRKTTQQKDALRLRKLNDMRKLMRKNIRD